MKRTNEFLHKVFTECREDFKQAKFKQGEKVFVSNIPGVEISMEEGEVFSISKIHLVRINERDKLEFCYSVEGIPFIIPEGNLSKHP